MTRIVFTAGTKITYSLGALLLFAVLMSNGRAENELALAWSKLEQRGELRGASMGFCLLDAQTGEEVFARNPDQLLVPASALKMLTIRAALLEHGPEFRFETTLEAHGDLNAPSGQTHRVLTGDLVIRPSGDPTLNSSYLKTPDLLQEWVDALRKASIGEIKGDLLIDASRSVGSPLAGSTAIEDGGNYYGAGAFALNFADNEVRLALRSGPQAGDAVSVERVTPPLDGVTFDCRATASDDQRDLAYVHGRPYDNHPVIYGTIPKGQTAFTIRAAMPNPPMTFLQQFQAAIDRAGITHRGALRVLTEREASHPAGQAEIIHTHRSPALREIVAVTGQKSINLYASALLRSLGEGGNQGAVAVGLTGRMRELLNEDGMDTFGMHVTDGSGLSRLNLVTARQLAQSCGVMKNKDADKALSASLKPFAGIPGVYVKSGYIERVRSYCGRVTLPDGRMYAFGILLNNYSCSPAEARKAIEAFVRHIPNP